MATSTGAQHRVKTMIIAGSGGHTTEMLRLMDSLGKEYSPKEYVLATTDKMSEDKIHTFEESRKFDCDYSLVRIPRSREVKQSYVTSIFTTLYASLLSIPVIFKSKPDLLLCNGPGTCIPLCVMAFLMTLLRIKKVTLVFVESVCRVKTMSLSGKILYYMVDHHLVQWPELLEQYPRSTCIGRLT